MKITSCIFVFLFLASSLNADERGFIISYETISIDNIRFDEKYHMLDKELDAGYHKTILKLEKDPCDREYIFKLNRPLLAKGKNKIECLTLRRDLQMKGKMIGENLPILSVSSRGFLPGERVEAVVSTKNRRLNSDSIFFFPQPLTKVDENGEARIIAELRSVSPVTNYKIYLKGFFPEEKVKFTSFSSGESMEDEITYEEKNTFFYYTPSVVGREGGLARINFFREDGTKISLSIPWGKELFQHLMGERKPVVSKFPTIHSTKT